MPYHVFIESVLLLMLFQHNPLDQHSTVISFYCAVCQTVPGVALEYSPHQHPLARLSISLLPVTVLAPSHSYWLDSLITPSNFCFSFLLTVLLSPTNLQVCKLQVFTSPPAVLSGLSKSL